MRQSECLGLQWGDVDLRAGVIHLTAQLSRPKVDKPGERVPLKTDVARTIDLDAALVAFLRERKEQAFAAGRAGASDWIFATASGGPPHYRNVGRAFELAAERAGLNPQGKRRLRFHDLRRTHASLLIEGGCEGPWVARRLGHSVEMLYSTYAGLFSSRSQRDKGLAAIAAARRQV